MMTRSGHGEGDDGAGVGVCRDVGGEGALAQVGLSRVRHGHPGVQGRGIRADGAGGYSFCLRRRREHKLILLFQINVVYLRYIITPLAKLEPFLITFKPYPKAIFILT